MAKPNFTPFPQLNTERTVLRQLTVEDQRGIFALRSDPEINRYLGRQPSKTIEDAIDFIHRINESTRSNQTLYWVIALKETNELLGTVGLFDFSEEAQRCEIGYELLSAYQGRGIMIEALEKVLDYAFQDLQMQQIIACSHKENLGSTRLLTKLRFRLSDETDMEEPDLVMYRKNRQELPIHQQ